MRYLNLIAEPASAGDFADVIVPAWGWPMLIGVITAALLIDLFIFHRRAHVVEFREAAVESAAYPIGKKILPRHSSLVAARSITLFY